MSLARTLVIKYEDAADSINRELSLRGHAIHSSDKSTWKYYMNLSGMYHPTDQMMTVTAMDTLETIEFTKENLSIYRATLKAYQYGTRYYRELVERYPSQETLILGILHPVDIEKAIEAEDGQILYYDRSLVEDNERSLIPKLESWIRAYFSRWQVKGYPLTDEYYSAARFGVMCAHLPQAILNHRLEMTHTDETHSFHIREYLASHGGLHIYLPYLNVDQALFLYRNIRYIYRHIGKQSTFDLLLKHILTNRRLPLATYELRHKLEDLLSDLLPKVEFYRNNLNDHPGDGSLPSRTLDEILIKQDGVARDNYNVHYEILPKLDRKMQYSHINQLPTKILESALLDTTDTVPYLKEEVFIGHWIYLASQDRLYAIVNVTNPVTGSMMALTMKEAFVLFIYSLNRSYGFTLDSIPTLLAPMVRKPILPTIHELSTKVDPDKVSLSDLADLLENQPAMGVYLSVESFREFVSEVHFAINYQRLVYAQQKYRDKRGMMLAATLYCYRDISCSLDSGQSYRSWLLSRGISPEDLSTEEYALLSRSIWTEVTGGEFGEETDLALLQRNMLGLMERLSSYSVQYLQSINSSSYRILDTPRPRYDNLTSKAIDHQSLGLYRVKPMSPKSSSHDGLQRRDMGVKIQSIRDSKEDTHISVSIPSVLMDSTHKSTQHFRLSIGSAQIQGLSYLDSEGSTDDVPDDIIYFNPLDY